MGRAFRVVPQGDQADMVAALVALTRRAAARGVTKVHEAATGMVLGRAEVDLLHAIAPQLATRASYAIYDGVAASMLSNGVQPGAGDDMVRAVSWKIISDGSNQGRSGYQYDDYLGRGFRGEPNHTVDYLAGQVALAHEHGWQVMIHANGDAAIGDVLDAYESGLRGASGLSHRDRIEHCSVPTDAQLGRMAALGVSPSFLMNHVYYWGRAFAERIFGEPKAGRLDPVRSALRHGLRPSLHSDYSVTDIDPLRAVQTAVTRRVRDGGAVLNAAECISPEEAMRAVTIDAAWQIHADDMIGSLEVGKYADLVVLADDPARIDPEGIAEIGIEQTLLSGRRTHGG
jgi:predicted amidohydrolase YtcJ